MIQNNVEQRKRLNRVSSTFKQKIMNALPSWKKHLLLSMETKGIHKEVRAAAKAKKIKKSHPTDLYTQSVEQNIISQEEFDNVAM